MRCEKCKGPLEAYKVGEHIIHACKSCIDKHYHMVKKIEANRMVSDKELTLK